jgi:hypothetical protein
MIDTFRIHTTPDKMFAFVDANATTDKMKRKFWKLLLSIFFFYLVYTYSVPNSFAIILLERKKFSAEK